MASDLGLVVILLWTISLQAVGSTGTNSNEGHRIELDRIEIRLASRSQTGT
ncbi:hypothetical protein NQZ68_024635 [Dissostichus eleginoides]|nr:hypothetical protein NQZ68_024635 [Dissostichus eleginoides]